MKTGFYPWEDTDRKIWVELNADAKVLEGDRVAWDGVIDFSAVSPFDRERTVRDIRNDDGAERFKAWRQVDLLQTMAL